MLPGWNSEHTPENCSMLFQTLHPAPRAPDGRTPRIPAGRPHIGPVIGQT